MFKRFGKNGVLILGRAWGLTGSLRWSVQRDPNEKQVESAGLFVTVIFLLNVETKMARRIWQPSCASADTVSQPGQPMTSHLRGE